MFKAGWTITILAAAVCVSPAKADFMYQYQGEHFTFSTGPFDNSQSVAGDFTTASPLGTDQPLQTISVTGCVFSAGPLVLACDDPGTFFGFSIATNHQGAIINWDIEVDSLVGGRQQIGTNGFFLDFAQLGNTGSASVFAPGTWSGPVTAIPEPSTVILMSTMLLAVALVARKRRSLRPATRTTPLTPQITKHASSAERISEFLGGFSPAGCLLIKAELLPLAVLEGAQPVTEP